MYGDYLDYMYNLYNLYDLYFMYNIYDLDRHLSVRGVKTDHDLHHTSATMGVVRFAHNIFRVPELLGPT